MTIIPSPTESAALVKQQARSLGFDLVGIAPAATPGTYPQFLEWLDHGFAGEMNYLPGRREAREHPRHVLQSVQSVVMLAVNYDDGVSAPSEAQTAKVARYARIPVDYHEVLRGMLKQLGDELHRVLPGCRTRGVVDTAPLLERDFARAAGLGWFGKNTMLINKLAGSGVFLAALLTDAELSPDAPHETTHCGTCTRCLDACPTDAFVEPYVLDATRCIAYLTIESRTAFPIDLREPTGNLLFGCDICQDVCPWNRKAPSTGHPSFQSVPGLRAVDAEAVLKMTAEEFEQAYGGTAFERPGQAGLRRNAAIVLGNRRDPSTVPTLIAALSDADATVRTSVAWALGRTGGESASTALQDRLRDEDNPDVRQEIHQAMQAAASPDDGSRQSHRETRTES